MTRALVAFCLAACALGAGVAQASVGNWDRAWGRDVDSSNPSTGFEICVTAASCTAGSAAGDLGGEFGLPDTVAVDPSGNVWVVDGPNARIQKFDSSGNFLAAFGKDVDASNPGTGAELCTVAASCKAGAGGALGGEFASPSGVAVDGAGNVFVTDNLNASVQELDPTGNFIRAWGKNVDSSNPNTDFEICTVAANCRAGDSTGVLGGELNQPTGVGTDSSGNVYVTDAQPRDRVQKFDPSGNFRLAWGKNVDGSNPGTGFEICTVAANCLSGESGGLGGELSGAFGVAADSAGGIYVADSQNNRVQKFDTAGNFVGTYGKDVDGSAPGTGFEVCIVAASCKAGAMGGLGGEMSHPRGIATYSPPGDVYVADSAGNRIEKFDSAGNFLLTWGSGVNGGTGFETCAVASSCKTGAHGLRGGELGLPNGVATDSAGALYVADLQNVRMQKFAAGGATALPPPVRGETVNAVPQKGTVLVKLPAGTPKARGAASGFVPLETIGRQIPVGSTLDTTRGTVRLFSATNNAGNTQNGDFSKGLFNIGQGRKNPLTTLSMTGGGLNACSKLPSGGSQKVSAAKRKRSLFSNVKGRFRVRGRNSHATVRGTRFLVRDTCAGTLTQVKAGSVKVRDFGLRKTRTVRAGHSYFARAPLRK